MILAHHEVVVLAEAWIVGSSGVAGLLWHYVRRRGRDRVRRGHPTPTDERYP